MTLRLRRAATCRGLSSLALKASGRGTGSVVAICHLPSGADYRRLLNESPIVLYRTYSFDASLCSERSSSPVEDWLGSR
jgi:hypothetical protein